MPQVSGNGWHALFRGIGMSSRIMPAGIKCLLCYRPALKFSRHDFIHSSPPLI